MTAGVGAGVEFWEGPPSAAASFFVLSLSFVLSPLPGVGFAPLAESATPDEALTSPGTTPWNKVTLFQGVVPGDVRASSGVADSAKGAKPTPGKGDKTKDKDKTKKDAAAEGGPSQNSTPAPTPAVIQISPTPTPTRAVTPKHTPTPTPAEDDSSVFRSEEHTS